MIISMIVDMVYHQLQSFSTSHTDFITLEQLYLSWWNLMNNVASTLLMEMLDCTMKVLCIQFCSLYTQIWQMQLQSVLQLQCWWSPWRGRSPIQTWLPCYGDHSHYIQNFTYCCILFLVTDGCTRVYVCFQVNSTYSNHGA